MVQDKTTPHAKLYISLIYTRLAWAFVSSIPVPHEILPEFLKRDKAKRFLYLICRQQVLSPVNGTNITKIQRSTNVFRDVVEQIYSFIDSSQDFREGTPMRLLHFKMSYLLWMPQNSLIAISTTPTISYHSIILHLFWCDTWYFLSPILQVFYDVVLCHHIGSSLYSGFYEF